MRKKITIGVVAVMAIMLLVLSGCSEQKTPIVQFSIAGQDANGVGNDKDANAQCAFAPTVAITGQNAQVPGTAATPTTIDYFVDGVYVGQTAPAVLNGEKWTIVGDLAGYLSTDGELDVGCGAQKIITKGYQYANMTVTFKDDPVTSSNTLFDGTTGNNATNFTGTRYIGAIFQGTSQRSTSSNIWIVESPANTGSSLESITATCGDGALEKVSIPKGISAANAASAREAFRIPAIVGDGQKSCQLILKTTSGTYVTGLFLNDFYSEQMFVNADGKKDFGIMDTTTNGANAVEYQATFDHDFNIN